MKNFSQNQHLLTLQNVNTRNQKLKRLLLEFYQQKCCTFNQLDRIYNRLLGYLLSCDDHFDIEEMERYKVQHSLAQIYNHKKRSLRNGNVKKWSAIVLLSLTITVFALSLYIYFYANSGIEFAFITKDFFDQNQFK